MYSSLFFLWEVWDMLRSESVSAANLIRRPSDEAACWCLLVVRPGLLCVRIILGKPETEGKVGVIGKWLTCTSLSLRFLLARLSHVLW
jgi:hypothetical protein